VSQNDSVGGSDAFGAAYDRLRAIAKDRSWRFEHPDDRRDFDFLAAHFAEKVDFGLSPRCDPRKNTEARAWCFANLGDDAVNYHRWTGFRVIEGQRHLGFDYTYNPEGSWLLVRRTYLFRDPNHAVWFKMVWW
jgi:hypothetical protein